MCALKASFEPDGRFAFDLIDLGIAAGSEAREITLPNGAKSTVVSWNGGMVGPALEEIKKANPENKPLHVYGMSASWMLAAIAYDNLPNTVAVFNPVLHGDIQVENLPQAEKLPDDNIGFILERRGDRLYAEGYGPDGPGKDAHSYDPKKLPYAAVPVVPEDVHVCFRGTFGNPIVASIVLGFARTARSVSVKSHDDPGYICAFSRCSEKKIGDFEPDPE